MAQMMVRSQQLPLSGPVRRALGQPSRRMVLATELALTALHHTAGVHHYAEDVVARALGSDAQLQESSAVCESVADMAIQAYQQRVGVLLAATTKCCQIASQQILQVQQAALQDADVRTFWEQLGDHIDARANAR
jgi:hypothetical protein